ncbi:mitochondrial cardiolipin hydrolase-like [Anticarsia gemmatalis]|uniref:mitochondrial cardiolipin hydrolase-like n=1 Tax=Anticarsia gemmatalis TaxID=129554 RepID=UPI003F75A18A
MSTEWLKALRTGGSYVCGLALKIFEINLFKNGKQQDESINEILLYGAENEDRDIQQIGLNNLFCIYYVILHASRSVEVCVPSLASDTLAKCLISVHQKNKVKVRITIHNSDNFDNLQLFAQSGIEIKIINPTVPLEHEFLLIDALDDFKDAVAVMGSLDYETTQVNCNLDATVLTSDIAVVTALKREFDRVWTSVPDIPYAKDDKVK